MADWHKQLPHLPDGGQTWLARNVWWIVLIGVILGALGILSAFSMTLLASVLFLSVSGTVGAAASGLVFLAFIVSMAFAAADVIVMALAIPQLKVMRSRGWTLLFIAALINLASLVVSFLLSFNVGSLIVGALGTAVCLYFVFEIRTHFSVTGVPRRRVVANEAK